MIPVKVAYKFPLNSARIVYDTRFTTYFTTILRTCVYTHTTLLAVTRMYTITGISQFCLWQVGNTLQGSVLHMSDKVVGFIHIVKHSSLRLLAKFDENLSTTFAVTAKIACFLLDHSADNFCLTKQKDWLKHAPLSFRIWLNRLKLLASSISSYSRSCSLFPETNVSYGHLWKRSHCVSDERSLMRSKSF